MQRILAAIFLIMGIAGVAKCGATTTYDQPVSILDTDDFYFYECDESGDETPWAASEHPDSDGFVVSSGKLDAGKWAALCIDVGGAGTLSFKWKRTNTKDGNGYFYIYADGNYVNVNGGNGYSYGKAYEESIVLRGSDDDWHCIEWTVETYGDSMVEDLLLLGDFEWTPAPADSMTVTFVTNGGMEIAPEVYFASNYVCFCDLPVPERGGCEFAGWYLDKELTSPVDESAALGFTDITLYAKWTIPVSLLDTDLLTFSEPYGNGQWSAEDGAGINDSIAAMATIGSSSYSLRINVPRESGTLSFKAMASKFKEYSGINWNAKFGCEHDWNFSFSDGGWVNLSDEWKEFRVDFLCGEPTVCQYGYEDCPTEFLEIYAYGDTGSQIALCDFQWTPVPETVKIHFDTRCGAELDSIDAVPGDSILDYDLPAPAYKDWTFMGWYEIVNEYRAESIDEDAKVALHDITLTAKWELPISALSSEGLAISASGGWEVGSGWQWWLSAPGDDLFVCGTFSDNGEWVDESYIPKKQKETLTATVVGPAMVSLDADFSSPASYASWMSFARKGSATLTASLDGKKQVSWSEAREEKIKISVPAGTHTIAIDLAGASWVDDYGEVWSPNVYIYEIKRVSTAPQASFGEWLKTMRNGNAWVAGDLPRFEKAYAARIAKNPADYEARIMHAATLVAQLGENKNVAAYAKKFGFTLNYLGMDVTGTASKPSGWPAANTMVDTIVKEGVPVLMAAIDDLEAIPSSWAGTVRLSASDFPVDEDVYVDIGDVLYARASLNAAVGLAYFLHGYDLTVDYPKTMAAVEYRPTIPLVKSAPSLTTEDGWDTALAAKNAKFLFSGTKLYVRAVFPDEIPDPDDAAIICNLYVCLDDVKKSNAGYELDGTLFGTKGDMKDYWMATYTEDDSAVAAALKKLYKPSREVYRGDDGCSVTYVFDFSGKKDVVAAGRFAIWYGYATITDGKGWDEVEILEDRDPAVAYKLITEQTKFAAKVRNRASLPTSKSWMTAALTCALTADRAVVARDDDLMHFVEYDSIDEEDINRVRNLTEKALASLTEAQVVDVQEEIVAGRETSFDFSLLPNDGVMQVYLGALFEGKITRDLLPKIEQGANGGPVPVVETIKDPTIAGLLPEFTARTWSALLRGNGFDVRHQPVTVKLDANGGKVAKKDVALGFDEESEENFYPELPVPTRAGFIFTGWATAKTDGAPVRAGDAYDAALFAGAKTPTLYAQWLSTYTITVKGENATAEWHWSDEQRKTLPNEVLEAEYEMELDSKGCMSVPAGAEVHVHTDYSSKDNQDNDLTFQKWTVSSSKANLGAEFRVSECDTTLVMPSEKLTLTAAYIDESTCGWLCSWVQFEKINIGYDEESGEVVYLSPPLGAFEWSVDGGKNWYKATMTDDGYEDFFEGDNALLKEGKYTVTWRSTDPQWSVTATKTKTTAEVLAYNSSEVWAPGISFTPQVVVDAMAYVRKDRTYVAAPDAGSFTLNPKDGLVPAGKTITLTAKASKDYAFQGWGFAKYWDDSHPDLYETAATWKIANYATYCCGLSTPASYLMRYIDPADKKVHVVAAFKALKDYSADDIVFEGFMGYWSEDCTEAIYDDKGNASVTIKAVAGCAIDYASDGYLELCCAPEASPITWKLDGKLPDGLKFDTKTGCLSGAPKKAGNSTVRIAAIDPAKNSKSITVKFEVGALPSWIVGEYRGMLAEEGYSTGYEYVPGRQNGILELTVKSDGKVSAKVITRIGTRSVSGTLAWRPASEEDEDSTGSFSFKHYDSKDESECTVEEFFQDGSFYGYADSYYKTEDEWVGGDMTGWRQDTKLLKDSPFLDKYYTFAFNAETTTDKSGYGYLTLKTDKKGAAKVTGQLPDGEKVSMSALVLPYVNDGHEAPNASLYVFASPSSYKKVDWFAMSLEISENGINMGGDGAWTPADIIVYPDDEYDDQDSQRQSACVIGSGAVYSEAKSLEDHYWTASCWFNENVRQQYSYKDDGETYYEDAYAHEFTGCFFDVVVKGDNKGTISLVDKSPAPWVEKSGAESYWNYYKDKTGKMITDPSQLSISFAKATGIFSGKALVYFDEPKPTSVSLPYTGVMISYDDYGDYYGHGSAVYTYNYSYIDDKGKAKKDTKKITLPVSLNPSGEP